jgi:hypothetical protein
MNTAAVILALSWLTPAVDALWARPLGGRGLLARVIDNCRDSGVCDAPLVLTDAPTLLAAKETLPVRVLACPDGLRGHPFNFLALEQPTLSREFDLTLQAGIPADLTFFLPWNRPFLDGPVLEKMYHTLLEDPLTARLVPVTPVNPQLLAKVEGAADFYPVWMQKGLDRQLAPQLLRPAGEACLTHWSRLLRGIPKIAGIRFDAVRTFGVGEAADCALADTLDASLTAGEVRP